MSPTDALKVLRLNYKAYSCALSSTGRRTDVAKI